MDISIAIQKNNTPGFISKHYRLLVSIFLAVIIYTFWIGFVFNTIDDFTGFLKIFLYATTYVLVVFFNIHYLLGKYLLKGHTGVYITYSMLSFLAASMVLERIYSSGWKEYFASFGSSDFIIETIILCIKFITFTSVGIAFRLLELWVNSERKIAALTHANLASELENLKKQVSPHFLFNTLNNLYVLARVNPPMAANTILELSDILKYQLYDCSNERVPLNKELNYIKQLLALEQLRKDKWMIKTDFHKNIPDHIHIASLLLIILVENAVKHGMHRSEEGSIYISCAPHEGKIQFNITNSIAGNSPATTPGSGLGLRNLERRLELLYPGKHELKITETTNLFSAELTITTE